MLDKCHSYIYILGCQMYIFYCIRMNFLCFPENYWDLGLELQFFIQLSTWELLSLLFMLSSIDAFISWYVLSENIRVLVVKMFIYIYKCSRKGRISYPFRLWYSWFVFCSSSQCCLFVLWTSSFSNSMEISKK